jgi:hypothetical protein
MGLPLLHQAVQIPSLMSTVKIAQTNVNNARGQFTAIIGWNFYTTGKVMQRCIRQAGDR